MVLLFGEVRADAPGALHLEVHPCQLGNPVHQEGDLRAKPGLQFFQGNAAVFDDIMEQGGDDGVVIQVKVGQEQSGFQGMGDIGLTGQPHLALVALFRKGVSLADELRRIQGQITGYPVNQGCGAGGSYPMLAILHTLMILLGAHQVYADRIATLGHFTRFAEKLPPDRPEAAVYNPASTIHRATR